MPRTYPPEPRPRFVIKDLGKGSKAGSGFLAVGGIPAGTLILQEECKWASSIELIHKTELVAANEIELAEKLRNVLVKFTQGKVDGSDYDAFLKLPLKNVYCWNPRTQKQDKLAPHIGRYRGLAIPLDINERKESVDEVGLFLQLCFLNHSCNPNAHLSYNPQTNVASLCAIRDIKNDEEIAISYVSQAKVDRKKLADIFDFKCVCDWCMTPNTARKAYTNNLRAEVDYLLKQMIVLEQSMDEVDVQTVLNLSDRMERLLDEEGMKDWRVGRCLQLRAYGMAKMGRVPEVEKYAERALKAYFFCEGTGSAAGLSLEYQLKRIADSRAAERRGD